jgi:hypothetical protein
MTDQDFPIEQFHIPTEKIKLDPNNPPHLQPNDFWTEEEIIKNFGSTYICYRNNVILNFYYQLGGYLGVIQNFNKIRSSLKHNITGKKVYIISYINGI